MAGHKNLDPSYKVDLDFGIVLEGIFFSYKTFPKILDPSNIGDRFRRGRPFLITEKIWCMSELKNVIKSLLSHE